MARRCSRCCDACQADNGRDGEIVFGPFRPGYLPDHRSAAGGPTASLLKGHHHDKAFFPASGGRHGAAIGRPSQPGTPSCPRTRHHEARAVTGRSPHSNQTCRRFPRRQASLSVSTLRDGRSHTARHRRHRILARSLFDKPYRRSLWLVRTMMSMSPGGRVAGSSVPLASCPSNLVPKTFVHDFSSSLRCETRTTSFPAAPRR